MLRRILLFTGVTLVVMLLFISLVTRTVLNEGFARLERGFVTRNLARVRNGISELERSIGATTTDWATWDEAYQFAAGRNRGFVENNLGSEVLANLHVNIVLFLNKDGKTVFGATFDPGRGLTPGIPPAFNDWLAAHPFMTRLSGKTGHAEGIIALPEGPIMAAARPILDSRGEGPVHGTLIMGRFLDQEFTGQLSRSLMITVALLPLPVNASQTRTVPAIDTSQETVVSGSAVLAGADGAPALRVKVSFPRDIHWQAVATARYFIAWLVVIGVVFIAVVLIAIQKTVLSRLQRLSAGVLAIGTGNEPGRRVAVKGTDEIAYLGAAINGMLDALEGSSSQLRQSERRNQAFLDAIPEVILRVSREGTIIDARFPPSMSLVGKEQTLKGATLAELAGRFPQLRDGIAAEAGAAIVQALETGEPVTLELSIDAGKGMQHFEARVVASGDAEAIIVTRETTAKRRVQEAQKQEVLLKEIHHRVKNNLQVISSLLSLQASTAQDPRTRSLLDESRHRVRSVALIHEKLYRQGEGARHGYAQYVRDLADQLVRFYKGDSNLVGVSIEVEDIPMDMDVSVPVGLIINELLANALAHAFPHDRRGSISVRMRQVDGDRIEIVIGDDGVGFPPQIDYRNPSSLGLRIVNMLVQQIRATLELESQGGTSFRVTFPASPSD
jgi:two-component sensor histidine kinase/sensor domain CHASE-containing protein